MDIGESCIWQHNLSGVSRHLVFSDNRECCTDAYNCVSFSLVRHHIRDSPGLPVIYI